MPDQVHLTQSVEAAPAEVWRAITEPAMIKAYFFGADVETDWRPGSPITWRGEYKGKSFRDKGEIVAFEPGRRLAMTHWSPLSGLEDVPENYHTVIWSIEPEGEGSKITLTQENLTGVEPDAARDSWRPVMEGLARMLRDDRG